MHISKNFIKTILLSTIFIVITFIIAIIFYNNENSDILNSSIGKISSRTSSYITNFHLITSMGFAFVAGVAAAFNPCGFVMLPAYIGLYLKINENQAISKKLSNALIVSLSMTMGFTILFALFAFIIGLGAKTIIYSMLPWMGISIGILLIIFGSSILTGNNLYTNIFTNIAQKTNIKNEENIKTYFMLLILSLHHIMKIKFLHLFETIRLNFNMMFKILLLFEVMLQMLKKVKISV